jgi:hypothetical protein
MMNSKATKCTGYAAQDDRDDFNFIFVHKALDDFGLDPFSFRIYSRIVRRAGKDEAFESNKNMALGCRMSEAQVKRSLKTLTKHGLIIKEKRPGTTCLYRVAPRKNWSEPIPPSTDSSDRPIRNESILDDTYDTSNVRLGLPELGDRSTRPNRLGLPDLQSNSLLNNSTKDLERSVVENLEEKSQAYKEVQVTLDSHFVVKKEEDSPTNEQFNHEDRTTAPPRENNSQNNQGWQCPDPKMRCEFIDWLVKTTLGIQTARHAVNWCNAKPQDADLAWDDFLRERERMDKQNASFEAWECDRHEMIARQYRNACADGAVFLDNFTAQNAAWLQWAQANHPEWLEYIT